MQADEVIQTFEKRVKGEMNRPGVSRCRACAAVATADPGLHRKYLIATDLYCPAAVRKDRAAHGNENILLFNEQVDAKVRLGMSSQVAAEAVAEGDPDLYRKYLDATTPDCPAARVFGQTWAERDLVLHKKYLAETCADCPAARLYEQARAEKKGVPCRP